MNITMQPAEALVAFFDAMRARGFNARNFSNAQIARLLHAGIEILDAPDLDQDDDMSDEEYELRAERYQDMRDDLETMLDEIAEHLEREQS